ncbi:MAG: ATP-binding cassette domain-containing protein [Burkholderiaceae bacterium]|nr:ATP-binding cassette domain-containing protein [Burkholderiaceae bacterium]
MLDIRQLDVSIGPTSILRKVNIAVGQGQIVGLTGRNGAGKTTLMRTIMGLLKPTAGSMLFHDQDLISLPAYKRTSLGIGYAPEDRRLIPDLSVYENLCAPAWALGTKDVEVRLKRVYTIIPELIQFGPRRAMQLSGGQQKLVAIGRALMTAQKLVLLDEPFEGVAPALSKRIADVVGELRQEGFSALLSGADLQHAGNVLDEIYRMDRGEMTADHSATSKEQ